MRMKTFLRTALRAASLAVLLLAYGTAGAQDAAPTKDKGTAVKPAAPVRAPQAAEQVARPDGAAKRAAVQRSQPAAISVAGAAPQTAQPAQEARPFDTRTAPQGARTRQTPHRVDPEEAKPSAK